MERFAFIAKSEKRLAALERLRRFMLSKPYLVILTVLACVITVTRMEFAGLLFFAFLTAITLFVHNETIASTLPFLLICSFIIKSYDSYKTYIKLIWLAPVLVVLILSHFILYRKPLKAGAMLKPQLAVTLAVTLGGAFAISAKDYFSLTSIYYILGLGIGMVLVYVIGYTFLCDTEKTNVKKVFAFDMYLVCIFACFMIISYYVMNIQKVMESRSILEPQWRNNVSTIIMLSMPFVFYRALRHPLAALPALITMPCLVMTSSRSGLVFGAIEFALCCIYIVYIDKKRRKVYLGIFAACAVFMMFLAGDILTFISKTLVRFGEMNDDPRAQLIKRAVLDFKRNPVFGMGIGYTGNRDIHPSKTMAACWYHSSPFQIIGSFGLLGIPCFGYQFYMRNKIFWSKINFYSIAVYISYIGILLMSLVNPGEFCPLPYELLVVFMFAILEQGQSEAHEKTIINIKTPTGIIGRKR